VDLSVKRHYYRAMCYRVHSLASLLLLTLIGCGEGLRDRAGDIQEDQQAAEEGIGDIDVTPECSALPQAAFICGGDPRGLWQIATACPVSDTYDPLDGTCDQFASVTTGSIGGIIEITSGGEMLVELGPERIDTSFVFDLACYGGATEPCDGVVFGGSCSIDATLCRCETGFTNPTRIDAGQWQRDDGELALFGSDFVHFYDYCRVGADVLAMTRPSVDGSPAWSMVLERIGDTL
jgi:hypothetical protein